MRDSASPRLPSVSHSALSSHRLCAQITRDDVVLKGVFELKLGAKALHVTFTPNRQRNPIVSGDEISYTQPRPTLHRSTQMRTDRHCSARFALCCASHCRCALPALFPCAVPLCSRCAVPFVSPLCALPIRRAALIPNPLHDQQHNRCQQQQSTRTRWFAATSSSRSASPSVDADDGLRAPLFAAPFASVSQLHLTTHRLPYPAFVLPGFKQLKAKTGAKKSGSTPRGAGSSITTPPKWINTSSLVWDDLAAARQFPETATATGSILVSSIIS